MAIDAAQDEVGSAVVRAVAVAMVGVVPAADARQGAAAARAQAALPLEGSVGLLRREVRAVLQPHLGDGNSTTTEAGPVASPCAARPGEPSSWRTYAMLDPVLAPNHPLAVSAEAPLCEAPGCGRPLTPRQVSRGARVCAAACRVAAHRARRRAAINARLDAVAEALARGDAEQARARAELAELRAEVARLG